MLRLPYNVIFHIPLGMTVVFGYNELVVNVEINVDEEILVVGIIMLDELNVVDRVESAFM